MATAKNLRCADCSSDFEPWELELGEDQPRGMPGGDLCRECWDRIAAEKLAESEGE